jgi:hypothetical protein
MYRIRLNCAVYAQMDIIPPPEWGKGWGLK